MHVNNGITDVSIDVLLIKKACIMEETQDKNEIHEIHQSLDNYHWPKGFMKVEIPLITSCQNYILALKPLAIFTDSDVIINYTSALASESKHRTLNHCL